MNDIVKFQFDTLPVRVKMINSEPCFALKDICLVLGITNQTKMKHNLDIKGVYNIQVLTIKGNQCVDFISEKNLYKCIFKSRMKQAEKFQDWVCEDILPTIRKTGGYSINKSNYFLQQTERSTQIENSKNVNSLQYQKGGVENIKEYNRLSCILHSGKTPAQLRKEGKEQGLKSKNCTSGKEVLRHTSPAIACGMSLADDIVLHGNTLSQAYEITKDTLPIYAKLLKLGIDINELKK
jgi:prophage antirepressor-like protein